MTRNSACISFALILASTFTTIPLLHADAAARIKGELGNLRSRVRQFAAATLRGRLGQRAELARTCLKI